MSMTKHTPVPWRKAVSESDRPAMMSEIEIVAPGSVKESCRPIARLSLQGTETKANARLIAAAPELLEALESLVMASAHCGESGWLGDYDPWENARAAIAKAKGELE